ncbi:MAG: ABC transporter ATP-binding protein [Methanosarcinaceae archaeon]|nr:ABC transporter ATP-binding protein [Methanosarcinaceae archaeon]
MIEIAGLRKEYGDFTAVDNLSFSVGRGEIFGIVGPNGAGKTTTLKMISGLIRQTSGTIRIKEFDLEENPVRIKSFLGFLPEESPLYEGMEVEDYLMFFSELYGIDKNSSRERINALLFDLALNTNGKKIGDLSKGMRRKVAIARSLINDPDVLVYDEPASGLDPMTSNYITNYISSLKNTGKTIIFSAHNLYQVQTLCDRILIMKDGKIITLGTMDDIQKEFGRTSYCVEFRVDDLSGFTAAKIEMKNEHYLVTTDDINVVNHTTKWVASRGGDIIEMRTIELSLEEIFLELMGIEAKTGG